VLCLCLQQVWKRSGAWFYKGLPKYIMPLKSSGKCGEVHSQPRQSEPAVPDAEGAGTSRSFTWTRGKGWLSALCAGSGWGGGEKDLASAVASRIQLTGEVLCYR